MTSIKDQREQLHTEFNKAKKAAGQKLATGMSALEKEFAPRRDAFAFFEVLDLLSQKKDFLRQHPGDVTWEPIDYKDDHESDDNFDPYVRGYRFTGVPEDRTFEKFYAPSVGALMLYGMDIAETAQEFGDIESVSKTFTAKGIAFFHELYAAAQKGAEDYSIEQLDDRIAKAKQDYKGAITLPQAFDISESKQFFAKQIPAWENESFNAPAANSKKGRNNGPSGGGAPKA